MSSTWSPGRRLGLGLGDDEGDRFRGQAGLGEPPASIGIAGSRLRLAALVERPPDGGAQLALGTRGRERDAGHGDRFGQQGSEAGRDHDAGRAGRDGHPEDQAQDVDEAILPAEDHVPDERRASGSTRRFDGLDSLDGLDGRTRACVGSARQRLVRRGNGHGLIVVPASAARHWPSGPGRRAIRPPDSATLGRR
jgi:hypothetical protein